MARKVYEQFAVPLVLVKGATFDKTFTTYTVDPVTERRTAKNITGWTPSLIVVPTPSPAATPIVTWDDTYFTITGAEGKAQFVLPYSTTAALTWTVGYYWFYKLVNPTPDPDYVLIPCGGSISLKG